MRKLTTSFLSILSAAMICSGLSSCNNELEEPLLAQQQDGILTRAVDSNNVDQNLKVASAELLRGNTYGHETVDRTIDGDLRTDYSGRRISTANDSVIILYTMEQAEYIDYVKLTQRHGQQKASIFKKGSISIRTSEETVFSKHTKFEVNPGDNVILDISTNNVEELKLVLYRSETYNNVGLAEFECFRNSTRKQLIAQARPFFTDDTYSELAAGITEDQIKQINEPILKEIAEKLYNNSYDKEFRVRTYESCKNPNDVRTELTIGRRSIYENPTGIHLKKDQEIMIFVSGATGPVNMAIADFRAEQKTSNVKLVNGVNYITPTHDGNAYIQYWNTQKSNYEPVKIHFCNGTELGFWDVRQGHTNEDWKRILNLAVTNSAKYEINDAMISFLGEYAQLANTVDAFERYVPENIEKVANMHDRVLYNEYIMMGLVKYDAVPVNRIFGKRSWGGSPNWAGIAANFPNRMESMLTEEKFLKKIWVFAHEFGHGNQISQMRGAGWTEVTNNLYGMYVQYQMCDRNQLRLEHQNVKRKGPVGEADNATRKFEGDLFNTYLMEAFVNRELYLQHGDGFREDKGNAYNADPFVSLVPLWQLTLYFMITETKPDFWPDVHWMAIHDRGNYSWGQKYCNFMKRAIDASGLNLCQYFEDMGLLRESSRFICDYGRSKDVTITAEMVQDVRDYAQGKPLPESPVMGYISANSVEAYKNKLPVSGSYNTGITAQYQGFVATHSVWKNAVAFETYENDKLIDICIPGTGDRFNNSTYIRYPERATRIEAVGYDGTRLLVYGNR